MNKDLPLSCLIGKLTNFETEILIDMMLWRALRNMEIRENEIIVENEKRVVKLIITNKESSSNTKKTKNDY